MDCWSLTPHKGPGKLSRLEALMSMDPCPTAAPVAPWFYFPEPTSNVRSGSWLCENTQISSKWRRSTKGWSGFRSSARSESANFRRFGAPSSKARSFHTTRVKCTRSAHSPNVRIISHSCRSNAAQRRAERARSGSSLRHPPMSASGTKPKFRGSLPSVRLPAHNRPSGLNVGSPLHSRPRSEGCRRSVHDLGCVKTCLEHSKRKIVRILKYPNSMNSMA